MSIQSNWTPGPADPNARGRRSGFGSSLFVGLTTFAVVVLLSACGGAPAAPHAASTVPSMQTVAPAPIATTVPAAAPTVTSSVAGAPAAANVPSCVQLFTANTGNLLAATFLADKCTMSGSTMDLTGSAKTADGRFIKYPNGVTVALAKVQRMPNTYGSAVNSGSVGLEPSYALVRVDLDVTNTGAATASLGALTTQTAAFSVMYGNAVTAPENPGVINTGGPDTLDLVHQDNPPAVVAPGTHADVYMSFSVPVADLAAMSVAVDPDPAVGYTPYRITDADSVMVQFH